jgi:hypothetical protein
MPASSVHFNGSVNLPDAESVMREIARRVPTGVRRMTDGETGERGYWIMFQVQKFRQMADFVPLAASQAYETAAEAPEMSQLRLAPGVSADQIDWPDLGYAAEYLRSFAIFDRLQQEGVIPPAVRFQVQYPTPLAAVATTIAAEDLVAVSASYEAALFADLARALRELPRDRCAVQWDVSVEFGLLEGGMGHGSVVPLSQLIPPLARCVDEVPVDVPVGVHLCYGDYGHQHFAEPESMQTQVELLNTVATAGHRTIDWASFTVPQARNDVGYFAPLGGLKTGPETELYFGLVPYHPDDQAVGTTALQREQIDVALAASAAGVRGWGICTECGMGRVEPADVPRLLDLHREILAA